MRHRITFASLLIVASGCATTVTVPANDTDMRLTTAAGEKFALAETSARHDATVLVWWASTCPCVRRYEGRVRDLAQRLNDRAVAFYYVSSNADDGPEQVLAATGKAPLPIIRDQGGGLAASFGVVSTPTVVVLDRAARVRFIGWLDNEHAVGDPDREPWLEDALHDVITHADAADTRRTPTWGCIITRSLGSVGRCHGPMATSEPAE